jgi:hypothetical protein
MDALILIFIVILIGSALTLIFYPLWQQTRPEAIFRINRAGQTLEEYQARYQALLDAIKDLMFDYEMGKVAADDYQALLNNSKLEAVSLRRQIDRLSHGDGVEVEATLDAEIETLVARMRNDNLDGNRTLLPEIDAEIELLKTVDLARHDGHTDGVGDQQLACPNCGNTYQVGDAFCTRCGQPVTGSEVKAMANTCPECGYAYQPGDAFCAQCGTVLKEIKKQTHQDAPTTELSI